MAVHIVVQVKVIVTVTHPNNKQLKATKSPNEYSFGFFAHFGSIVTPKCYASKGVDQTGGREYEEITGILYYSN